jgi:hypothetical protein
MKDCMSWKIGREEEKSFSKHGRFANEFSVVKSIFFGTKELLWADRPLYPGGCEHLTERMNAREIE